MTHQQTEREVWLQNVRDHQIGGETDGISEEVAEDLGFRRPEPEEIATAGSTALLATGSETNRARRTRRKLSQTPGAIRARERRAKARREISQRIAKNSDAWGPDLGGI